MKKILFILCIVSTLCCMAQKKYPTPHEVTNILWKENYSDLNTNAIYEVKIYIIDSYHVRRGLVKELIYVYNINYVRTHYSTYIYTLERNTIERLYDSIFCVDTLVKIDREKVKEEERRFLPNSIEPIIVIDFVINPAFCSGPPRIGINENGTVLTIGIDRSGCICIGKENNLYYPNPRLLKFIEEYFHHIIRFSH